MTLMTVISEDLLSRGQAGKIRPKVPACPRARQKVAKLVSPCHRVIFCHGASKVGNKVLYLCYTVQR